MDQVRSTLLFHNPTVNPFPASSAPTPSASKHVTPPVLTPPTTVNTSTTVLDAPSTPPTTPKITSSNHAPLTMPTSPVSTHPTAKSSPTPNQPSPSVPLPPYHTSLESPPAATARPSALPLCSPAFPPFQPPRPQAPLAVALERASLREVLQLDQGSLPQQIPVMPWRLPFLVCHYSVLCSRRCSSHKAGFFFGLINAVTFLIDITLPYLHTPLPQFRTLSHSALVI